MQLEIIYPVDEVHLFPIVDCEIKVCYYLVFPKQYSPLRRYSYLSVYVGSYVLQEIKLDVREILKGEVKVNF